MSTSWLITSDLSSATGTLVRAQVDVSAFDDVPGLRFAVRPAQVLSRERDMRMGVHWKALSGIQAA